MAAAGWRGALLRLLVLVLCSPAMQSKITMNQVWRDTKNEPIQVRNGRKCTVPTPLTRIRGKSLDEQDMRRFRARARVPALDPKAPVEFP